MLSSNFIVNGLPSGNLLSQNPVIRNIPCRCMYVQILCYMYRDYSRVPEIPAGEHGNGEHIEGDVKFRFEMYERMEQP